MAHEIDVELNGIELRLHCDGAVSWPEQQTLFVADTHFGKEATFRRHGIPVPIGGTRGTLATIEKLIHSTEAKRLVILGDMFHARSSLSRDVVSSLEVFFSSHPSLQITLVRGNHDAHVGQLPPSWPVQIVDPYYRLGDVVMTHHPQPVPTDARVLLCGHLHPAVAIGASFGKLPCFHYRGGMMVLPAIGRFTGTHVVQLERDDRAWAIAENEIFPLGARLRSNV